MRFVSKEAKLGAVPAGNEGRDAVHIAIVPVQAAEGIGAGCPVQMKNGKAVPCNAHDADGIADPFRRENIAINYGEWFWLCLFPGSITNLRHAWEHPLFPSETKLPGNPDQVASSKAWLEQYVKRVCPYDNDISGGGYEKFLRNVREGQIFYHGHDCHNADDVEDETELYYHLSVILNRTINRDSFESFSCSC